MALDIAPNMLKETRLRSEKIQPVLADAQKLPFKDQSFSFIFSNFALQWCHIPTVLNEVKRILEPQGSFVLPCFIRFFKRNYTCMETRGYQTTCQ